MATALTDTWAKHAFPEDIPAKEQVWAETAERHRQEDRRDIYLENSGSDLKIRRHTRERDNTVDGRSAKDRALNDLMLLALGTPAYQAAYDNRLSFTIDGADLEITQGVLYERAQERAEALHQQISRAKQRDNEAATISRMEADLRAFETIRDNADPRLGKLTPARQQVIEDSISNNAALQEMIRQDGYDLGGPRSDYAETPDASDIQEQQFSAFSEWNGGRETSFAAAIDEASSGLNKLTLSAEFAVAKERETLEPDNAPEPTDPGWGTGLTL